MSEQTELILQQLQTGEKIAIKMMTDKDGTEIPGSWLRMDLNSGKILLGHIICKKSAHYNLGECSCDTHPHTMEKEMPLALAKGMILSLAGETQVLTPEQKAQRALAALRRAMA